MSGELRTFGPYQLVRRLGMGGMAETFEAVRLGPGGFEQRVCVKRILPTFEQDEQFVRLFLEEARVAARLRHANIVQVIDFGLAEGSHYLALELVLGCDLRELIRAERARAAATPNGPPPGLTSGLVAYLAQELAVALEIAHGGAETIVHRDISPSNVLLSTAGEVKLSDFGIARAIGGHHATATSTIKGKVPYMAPEYALRGHVDRRVDLFALGVLLYECLAGVRPFDGTSELDTLSNIERGAHVPLRERCPGAPSALVDAVEQLILPDPGRRIQSAAALLDALIDVAPPPTARRILGDLVTRARAARPGGDASGTAVDVLAKTSIAPAVGGGATTAAPAKLPASPSPLSTTIDAPIGASARPITRAAESPGPPTAVLAGAQLDARPGAALPFAAAGSADVTRTAAPAHAVADAETRAGGTRTIVDSANAVSDAETRMLPRVELAGASLEPTSGGTFDPRDLERTEPRASRRRAPIGLIAVGSVALLGSAALALFLAVAWQRSPTTTDTTLPIAHTAAPFAVASPPVVATPIAVAPPAAVQQVVAPPPAAVQQVVPPPAPAGPVAAPPPAAAPVAAPARVPAPEPIAAVPAVPRTSGAAQREERTKRRDARTAATAAANEDDLTTRALLSVVSDRGGEIYIDGRRVGASPVSVTVPPGRHVLANGTGDDAASLVIDIARGERRRVVLR